MTRLRAPLAAVTLACTLAACSAIGNFDRELATRDLATTESAPTESEARELVSRARDLAALAAVTLDDGVLEEARAALARAAETIPGDGWLEYHAAHVAFLRMTRALYLPGVEDREEEFERNVGAAVVHAEKALEALPDESEVLALLASIHGERIGQDWMLGIGIGPQCDEWIERALQLAPENPRAWLSRGTSLHFKPGLFGGDEEEALDAFGRAAELLDRGEAADSMRPTWGRAEVHAWMGQVLRELGRDDEALAEYQRALEIAPDFGWVRDWLLPSLEGRLGAASL